MYTRSVLSNFWDSILISAASQNALKKFSQKLIVFSNNNKNPDSFHYYDPWTDFYVDKMISPDYFKDPFMDTFGPVAYVFEHCRIYFSVFLLFKLIIYVMVMVIRHLEITKRTGASLEFGETRLSASYNNFLMSVLSSMYDPRAPTLAAVEEDKKTLCNEEELYDMKKDTKRRRNIFTQSGVRLNSTKPWPPFSLFKLVLKFFNPNYIQSFLLVTIVFQSSLTQKQISDPLRLRVWTSH